MRTTSVSRLSAGAVVRDDVARDLSASASDFERIVWPAIKPLFGHGRMVSIECATSKGLTRDFDVLAGIDGWHMLDDKGVMRGVASRVQWGDKSWRTFSIRRERPNGSRTEMEKRLYAIDNPEHNWLIPALTVQAYLTKPKPGGALIEAAVIRTRDLYRFARDHPCAEPRYNPEDKVLFDWFRWNDLKRAGLQVGIVPPGRRQ